MKKLTNIFILLFLILIGFFIRITFLDKPEGLWNDEYIGWWISSTSIKDGLFNRIFSNCHMPIYYFYLKGWMYIFGESDLALRFSSVFIGSLYIISSYFLGKTFKDKTCGLLCALFTTFSSFAIYFSQEVRPYSLIFLISTLLSIFFIKSLRKLTKTNFLLYIFFNFLLLTTHTISFVYVFFNLLLFSLIIFKTYPQLRTKISTTYIVLILLFTPFLPFLINVLTRETLSQNWGEFTLSKILFCFIDYFTPVLTNITNSPINLISFIKSKTLFHFIGFVLFPFSCAIFFLIKALQQKNKELQSLTLCALLYFSSLIVAAIMGKLILSTKYSVEIFPTLILLFAYGSSNLPQKTSRIFIYIYFIICLIFIGTNPNAPQRQTRLEGHKVPAILLNQANFTKDDYIISLYHQFFRYEKYFDFKPLNVINIDKNNIGTYIVDENYHSSRLATDGKLVLHDSFQFKNNKNIDKNFDAIFEKIPQGKKIHLIIPAQVAFFSSNDLIRIAKDKQEYERTQIIFLAFSYAKIKLINSASKYCSLVSTQTHSPWYVLTLQKN